MSLFGDTIFPRINDYALGPAVDPFRAEVAGQAEGRVLEIGAGTGLNFRHYPAGVDVIAVEPAPGMLRKAVERAQEPDVRARITVQQGRARALPFADESFDTVAATFVLCSVGDLEASVREIRRVLRRGGSLRLVEHVRSPDASLAAWQRRIRPLWRVLLAGCDPFRDVLGALDRAELDTSLLRRTALPLPGIVRAGLVGASVRP
jgi:SAM-dependent methyltransferase